MQLWWNELSALRRGAICGLILLVLVVLLVCLFSDAPVGELFRLDTWRSTHFPQALLLVFVLGFGLGLAIGPDKP